MRITIAIAEPAAERLRDEARAERRPTREHAAYLLERLLLTDKNRAQDERASAGEVAHAVAH